MTTGSSYVGLFLCLGNTLKETYPASSRYLLLTTCVVSRKKNYKFILSDFASNIVMG